MTSCQNICNNCQTLNPLGNTQCISCSNTLVPIHNRDDIVQQFVNITAATREQAESLLEISNSVDDAVNLFFDTGGIDSENSKGVANFKKGMNGTQFELIGTYVYLPKFLRLFLRIFYNF